MNIRILACAGTCLLAASIASVAQDSVQKRTWNYLYGDYGQYNSYGVPWAIWDLPPVEFPAEFYSRLSAALPESTDIRLTNPAYITANGANLDIVEEADVFFTFLHEGAGYRNSIGFFTYPTDSPPTSRSEITEVVVFPNLSYGSERELVCQDNVQTVAVPGAQVAARLNDGAALGPCPGDYSMERDGMLTGDTVLLGRFYPGTSIGFFVIANGWDSTNGVKPSQSEDWIFYSAANLNAETDPGLRAHTVLLYDEPTETVVLGMEDILRTRAGCDHDFNDAMFTIQSNPPEGIDTSTFIEVPEPVDTDGDGVVDGNDAFPEDPTRAFINYYPSKTTFATLSFEDRWPFMGDYDMNDLVIRYQIEEVVSRSGAIRDVKFSVRPVARGASYHNGLAWEITGVPRNSVDQAQVRVNDGEWRLTQPEVGNASASFVLFRDAHAHTPSNLDRFFNVDDSVPAGEVSLIELQVTFDTSVSPSSVPSKPYNPFIFRTNDRGLEIHLPGMPPTSLADASYFGTEDDTTSTVESRYYVTETNLPWALNIPYNWVHPRERVDIIEAYKGFGPWASSSGNQNKQWYTDESETDLLYPHRFE